MNRRVFSGAAALATLTAASAMKPRRKPNILMIVADDITDDLLACCGGKVLTPTIDRLAEQGTRFTRAYATSAVCTPSRYSLQTGAYPSRCEGREFLEENKDGQPATVHFNVTIDERTPTLAKALRAGGYHTGFAGKWHIAPHIGELGLEKFNPNDDPADPAVDAKLRRHQAVAVEEIKRLHAQSGAASQHGVDHEGRA